mgnify:CR=1 FL=1
MERVTFQKFSIMHKLPVVSFVRDYNAHVDEHCLKWELSNNENANAVAVVRDSSLKVQNRSKFKATSWVWDMKKMADRSKEVIINKRTLFATARRWPRPLNGGGGHLLEVVSLSKYNKWSWDFDMWSLNGVRPLSGGPLDRGSTVL